MRITYLAPYVPHPQIPHAGGFYFFKFLEALATKGLKLNLIAPKNQDNLAALPGCPDGVNVHLVDTGDRPAGVLARAVSSFPRPPGGLTPGGHVVAAFRDDPEVARLCAAGDVVEAQWGHYLPLLPAIRRSFPDVPFTALAYDVISESVAARRSKSKSPAERFKSALDLPRIRRAEAALLNGCETVFVFAGKDQGLLRKMGVTSSVVSLDPYLSDPGPPSQAPDEPTVLFMGALDRPENWEGTLWFLEQVWPAVMAGCPDAKFVIAGANPPDVLRRHASDKVIITGWVDDLDPYFAGASVFVAPLFSAGGLKFKVPQAMLHALPVVATPVAVEGVVEECGSELFAGITSDPLEMARAVNRMLTDRQAAAALGTSARAWAAERYSFRRTVDAALGVYERLCSHSPARGCT